MNDKIFITSVILVVIWSISYFLWNPPAIIHSLLVIGFAGILTSVFIDENRKVISKNKINY